MGYLPNVGANRFLRGFCPYPQTLAQNVKNKPLSSRKNAPEFEREIIRERVSHCRPGESQTER